MFRFFHFWPQKKNNIISSGFDKNTILIAFQTASESIVKIWKPFKQTRSALVGKFLRLSPEPFLCVKEIRPRIQYINCRVVYKYTEFLQMILIWETVANYAISLMFFSFWTMAGIKLKWKKKNKRNQKYQTVLYWYAPENNTIDRFSYL